MLAHALMALFPAIALFAMPLTACQDGAAIRPDDSSLLPTVSRDTLLRASTMGSARAAHTATTLLDGHVLLVGGFTGTENSAAGAEIYDASSNSFAPAGPMQTPRHSHSATRLLDGKVLIAGGYDARGDYLASTELYDPVSDTFSPTSPMGAARAGHVAVLLRDGHVLLVGGVGTGWSFLSSAEIYDPATASFTPTGAMTVPRESHAAVLLRDGRVLVIGGHSGRRAAIQIYSSAEIYDPASGQFSEAGDMGIRRHKHDAIRLGDGRVLVTGGTDERDSEGVYRSAEIYDPSTGSFIDAGEMRLPRYKHQGTSSVLPDGRVLLGGGAAQAEIYLPETGRFVLVDGDERMAGQFSAGAMLPDGSVLISGGYGEGIGPVGAAWVYRR